MLFNSLHFIFFFVLVTAIYFALAHRYRWQWLLLASCYFYMVFVPVYLVILAVTIVIDYFAGIWIFKAEGKARKWLLSMSIVANVGILALFKYYNFINENLTHLLGWFQQENPIPYLTILLPIGLSFHTFQAMSYTIEVYRGNQLPERHFGLYALYVMFFPQLVAGPIERPQNMLHQFRSEHVWNWSRFFEGSKWMIWGFFMKLVVADRLAEYVDSTIGNPMNHSGWSLWVGSVFFAFQIYCDFAGYSLIALGSARIMGFDLMVNFRRPYLAQSVSEFWSRWHISLSTWFRDYVYIALGGNRVGSVKKYRNLLTVFLLSGLWHGASWTFVVWGGLNGVFLVISQMWKDIFAGFMGKWNAAILYLTRNIFLRFFTFVLIVFTWVFFRAVSIEDALFIVSKMTNPSGPLVMQNRTVFYLGVFSILILMTADFWMEYSHRGKSISPQFSKPWLEAIIYLIVIILILMIGVLNGGQFIYFQF